MPGEIEARDSSAFVSHEQDEFGSVVSNPARGTDRSDEDVAVVRVRKGQRKAGHRQPRPRSGHLAPAATIDLKGGAYPAAREKFARSLEIGGRGVMQAIGDPAGEAATFLQLRLLA